MHSFTDDKGQKRTACCECNRGGNGNDHDKCSCCGKCIEWDSMDCFIGENIIEGIKPAKKGNSFEVFAEKILSGAGAAANMPYEVISKDFSKTNYSSARAALQEAWRN